LLRNSKATFSTIGNIAVILARTAGAVPIIFTSYFLPAGFDKDQMI